MHIVIDIPENSWEEIRHTATTDPDSMNWYERKISEGKPLPKGHGKLVDVKQVVMALVYRHLLKDNVTCGDVKRILDMATLIEADKEV